MSGVVAENLVLAAEGKNPPRDPSIDRPRNPSWKDLQGDNLYFAVGVVFAGLVAMLPNIAKFKNKLAETETALRQSSAESAESSISALGTMATAQGVAGLGGIGAGGKGIIDYGKGIHDLHAAQTPQRIDTANPAGGVMRVPNTALRLEWAEAAHGEALEHQKAAVMQTMPAPADGGAPVAPQNQLDAHAEIRTKQAENAKDVAKREHDQEVQKHLHKLQGIPQQTETMQQMAKFNTDLIRGFTDSGKQLSDTNADTYRSSASEAQSAGHALMETASGLIQQASRAGDVR